MRTALIRLSLAKGIGPSLLHALIRYSQDVTCWAKCPEVTARQKKMIITALADDAAWHTHEAWCKKTGTRVVTILDKEFPEQLTQIATPPVVLWVQGSRLPDGPACALVGSRDISSYARRVVLQLVPALVRAGVCTVSGGARGVDGAVHELTIQQKGKTVVVMGSGLQHCYPSEHAALFADVVASGGVLISPFAPDIKPSTGTFPARNRIIAGLCTLCVVVQAARKSGALITALYALEQNREVSAVPGPIDDARHAGSNALLSQGALVVTGADVVVQACVGAGDIKSTEQVVTPEKISDEERAVLEQLDQPVLFDTLRARLLDVSPAALHATLFKLQLAGKVKQNFAGMWERYE